MFLTRLVKKQAYLCEESQEDMPMYSYREFLLFLEDNRCRKEFETAFYSYNRCHRLSEGLWNIMGGDECFISRAFDWTETKEGREFWAILDNAWYEVYVKNNL